MKYVITILVSLGPLSAGLVQAQFGEPSGWESFRSRLRPENVSPITQNFGWSATRRAGGEASGEIGGRIQRALKRCRYAMHLAETLTLDKAISAQGTLAVTDDEGSSGALIGFFNESSEGWRTPNSLAFRVDGNGGNYWLFFEYGTRNGKTGGMGVFEGERYQTTKTRPFDADGTMHTWQLNYDPMAGDYGMLNFQVDGKDYSIELTKEARSDGAQFNRFGLWNQQTTGNGLELWIDELFVQGKPASFDSDPKWISENNRSTFQPAAVRPFHDYGFETDAKSIRGVIWRDETPSYCAKPIARLTLKQPLRASGRIRLNQAAADSGLYLGWFDSETKRKNDHPEHERRQRNYLALHIEGPSRVGHYVRPGYGTQTGRGRNAESGPVLHADGTWHQWSIDYHPKKRFVTVTLDESSVSLELDKEDFKDGAMFDRFGVFNHQSGGWHLDFEIEQLEFTEVRSVPR